MRWSFPIARIAGIDVRVHATFALALLFGAWQWSPSHGLRGALFGAGLTALLFVGVTLHELGHGIAARAFGVPVRDIVLLPIGGVATMTRKPSRPWHELVIAVAGPAVNVVLAAGLLVALLATSTPDALFAAFAHPSESTLGLRTALAWLFGANVMLAVFNMIPALPMDGGRVLRAVLAMLVEPARATRWAARVGQAIAIGLGAVALFSGQIFLGLVAAFVFAGASGEHRSATASTVLAGLRAGSFAAAPAHVLDPSDRIAFLTRSLLAGAERVFAVVANDELVGLLDREAALAALARGEGRTPVATLMQTDVVWIDAGRSLADVQRAMEETGSRAVAVADAGVLVGLVHADHLALAYELARRGGPAPGPWPADERG